MAASDDQEKWHSQTVVRWLRRLASANVGTYAQDLASPRLVECDSLCAKLALQQPTDSSCRCDGYSNRTTSGVEGYCGGSVIHRRKTMLRAAVRRRRGGDARATAQ